MNIVISHLKTKRRIDGPFQICGTRKDLREIAETILKKTEVSDWLYGWIDIPLKAESLADTPVSQWE